MKKSILKTNGYKHEQIFVKKIVVKIGKDEGVYSGFVNKKLEPNG